MNAHELIGYLASLLVLATFCMSGMVPLRAVAIASNVAFIGYAALAGISPVLLLHALLLPMNVYRALQRRSKNEYPAGANWVLRAVPARLALRMSCSWPTTEARNDMMMEDLSARPHSEIRSRRERATQTLWFEALGLLIVCPLFAHFAGASTGESLALLIVL